MSAAQLVSNLKRLVSMPEVCVRVNQMIESPRYSAADIGELIAQDTDLSARLLRTVNSAMYGLPVPVETISRAVTVIGTKDLRDLAVMTAARQLFSGIPADLTNMTEFWHYSISTGVYARLLAHECRVLHSERLFVMGVLHDIGRLAIFQHLPAAARDILLISEGYDDLLTPAEQDVLGFDHTEVGYELMTLWGLPETLRTAIRYHHRPDDAPSHRLETSLVHIASILASGAKWGLDQDESLSRVQPVAWEVTGLTAETIAATLDQAEEQINDMTSNMFAAADPRRSPGR